jgi:hypothetical protein
MPTQVTTSIRPHGFLIEAFRENFDRARIWDEVERRYGPRQSLSDEERAEIKAEISAPVRSWKHFHSGCAWKPSAPPA